MSINIILRKDLSAFPEHVAEAIEATIKLEKQKLKPQHQNAGLLVEVHSASFNPLGFAVDVKVKSIVNGLSTREELYK